MVDGITIPPVDTSSYKNALPTNSNVLEQARGFGGLEQQKVQIDQQKFNLMKDRFNIISNELGSLASDPDITREKVLNRINFMNKLGFMTPDQVKEFSSDIPNDPKQIAQSIKNTILRGGSVMEKIQAMVGQPSQVDTGAQIQPGMRNVMTGGFTPSGQPIQKQLPVETLEYDQDPNSSTYGQQIRRNVQPYQPPPPQAPIGGPVTPVVPATPLPPGGLPATAGAPQATPTGLPVASQPATPTPMGEPPAAVGGPRKSVASMPPGYIQAEEKAGGASGEQLANARISAANYQRDIFPLTQAIPALKRLGTKGTGPGTEEINQLKSFVLSNVPGVKSTDFNNTVEDFDKVKKYLTDFVNQTGNTGTNDKLAAAFAGNPSVGISNAAAVDVAKSALALRKMQQAAIINFERLSLPASQFSRYMTQTMNTLDPRAFGFNDMEDEKQRKLIDKLKKNPKEAENFRKSYELAKELGL